MQKRGKRLAKKGQNRINSIAVVTVMLIFITIIAVQINQLEDTNRKKDQELKVKQEAYDEESKRTEELEEQRVYVQTKKYIEESAKKLGFVYPDEIIFKPVQD